mmetsp:Transcript_40844/g.108094  ORF Transcript_40844/g.108094 Transcript_40844/m.108094 type:complete len:264 (-) Transcript_40844:691-1482(-)
MRPAAPASLRRCHTASSILAAHASKARATPWCIILRKQRRDMSAICRSRSASACSCSSRSVSSAFMPLCLRACATSASAASSSPLSRSASCCARIRRWRSESSFPWSVVPNFSRSASSQSRCQSLNARVRCGRSIRLAAPARSCVSRRLPSISSTHASQPRASEPCTSRRTAFCPICATRFSRSASASPPLALSSSRAFSSCFLRYSFSRSAPCSLPAHPCSTSACSAAAHSSRHTPKHAVRCGRAMRVAAPASLRFWYVTSS